MSKEHTYIKKPIAVQAYQMTKTRSNNIHDWPQFLREAWNKPRETVGSICFTEDGALCIGTLEGNHIINWGDYIICGIKGEIYNCRADIFEATYEKALILDLGR